MEEQETVIESLVENVEKYTATTIELAKLKSILKTSDVLSNVAVSIVLLVTAFLAIVFLSIGAAFWLGELLESVYAGFLLVAGFYAFAGILLFLLRKRLLKGPISNALINHFIE
jgi:hypothetical protein